MASGQQFLFAPEKPLVKRLGATFFRNIPKHAGVYKMRDAQDKIVYVGKARNLRQRLQSYRVANPERKSRRHLRMLREVTRIEFDLCHNETFALKHEAKLIRELKPKFNRAGVWQGKPQFLAWRFDEHAIEFEIQETPLAGWERFGSLGAYAPRLRSSLIRLIWLAMNPEMSFSELPHGWAHGRFADLVTIDCGTRLVEAQTAMQNAFWSSEELCTTRLAPSLNSDRSAFERAAILRDVEELQEFIEHHRKSQKTAGQMMLL